MVFLLFNQLLIHSRPILSLSYKNPRLFLFPSLQSSMNSLQSTAGTPFFPIASSELPSSSHPSDKHLSSLKPFSLTKDEEELFQTIRNFITENNLNTTVRVAGGWVRDKLLGIQQGKNDIDLALDNISGSQFAQQLSQWNRNGPEHQQEAPLHFHVIQFNPKKSKHLETASMKYLNFEIDFCGLRTDNYTSDSRIPTISYGTPTEDAHRRDLTINSLFYNINTSSIEDFTQRGLQDLVEKRISTPLPPLVTLQDDPLRCLRVVRFANRFNFSLTHELAEACQDPLVHESLERKVSSERIAQELNLMIGHPDFGVHALPLLHQLHLLPRILRTPPSHTLYRFFESTPVSKLNWRLLWTPLQPNQGQDVISQPIQGSRFDSVINAWKSSSAPSPVFSPSPSPLLDCVEIGDLDSQRLCQSAVCLNLLIDHFPLSSNSTIDSSEESKRLLR
jgi:tRNA nucleotidyltransferase/poly(A) polymerase